MWRKYAYNVHALKPVDKEPEYGTESSWRNPTRSVNQSHEERRKEEPPVLERNWGRKNHR